MERASLLMMLLWLATFLSLSSGTNLVSPTPMNGATTFKKDLTEPAVMVKIIYTISYETVRTSLNEEFKDSVKKALMDRFKVSPDRISKLDITPDRKGRTVVTFELSTGGVSYLSIKVALNYFDSIEKSKNTLNVQGTEFSPIIQYCNQTVDGCLLDDQCAVNCETKNLYPILVLLLIPFIVASVIGLLWYFKYKKPGKTRIDLTGLGYVENRSKFGGTVASRKGTMSGISLADNGVRNEVYTTMGKKYGFSLDNADFSPYDDQKETS